MFNLLNTTCKVNRPTYGQDANLGVTTNPLVSVYKNVPCTIQPASPQVQDFYGQRQIGITHTIYVNQILALKRGDMVVSGGLTYQVQGWEDMGGRGLYQAIQTIVWEK